MDNTSYIRVPNKWVRIAMTVTVTTLITAPLTAWAGHVFTDVPNSNTFHNDITWMADAGVTKGCNPPANDRFCPDDNVSRGQMSAFMRRFAKYIDAEDGTPAQADNATTANEADTLDGFDANSLIRVSGSATDNPSVANGTVESVDIEAPTDGYLFISALTEASDANSYLCVVFVDGAQAPEVGYTINVYAGGNTVTCPNTMVVPVTSGAHTVELITSGIDGGLNESSLSAVFIPFGSDGAGPGAIAPLGGGDSSFDE